MNIGWKDREEGGLAYSQGGAEGSGGWGCNVSGPEGVVGFFNGPEVAARLDLEVCPLASPRSSSSRWQATGRDCREGADGGKRDEDPGAAELLPGLTIQEKRS